MAVKSASPLIDRRIRDLGGWRGETVARMRALILQAVPGTTEEWKWNTPVWSRDGIVCTGEAYAKVVKLTFARGAALPDPSPLFNSSLAGNTRRAIDISLRPIPPGGTVRSRDARWIDLQEGELDEAQMAQMTKWVKQAAALPGWTP